MTVQGIEGCAIFRDDYDRSLVACHAGAYLETTSVDVARAVGVSRQAVNVARDRGVALAAEMRLGWED